MEIKTNTSKTLLASDRLEQFAFSLFLSLTLHEVIKNQLERESDDKMKDWITQQVVASATLLFPDPAEA
tara:strand:- start:211 stop:417 length:207 start_codon:yes stop_codon:yes gene_type:complete